MFSLYPTCNTISQLMDNFLNKNIIYILYIYIHILYYIIIYFSGLEAPYFVRAERGVILCLIFSPQLTVADLDDGSLSLLQGKQRI